jgi:hypothetical protein
MVKNAGGNKSKRIGRKHLNVTETRNVRYATEIGEEYAVVTKLHGSNCQVTCINGVSRVCVIRKKFKGRGKRDNIIMPGIWVIVGIRDWEVPCAGKQQKCDLLEVYSRDDRDKLIQTCPDDFGLLRSISDNGDDGSSNVEFMDSIIHDNESNESDENENENENDDKNNDKNDDKNENEMINDDEINIDDI